VSEELLTYARTRTVSKMVIGKPRRPRWREVVFGSVVEELIKQSGDIDVYVISGDQGDSRPLFTPLRERASDWLSYAWGLGSVALCTALARLLFSSLAEANLIMLYLLGVTVVAMRCGRGPAIWASVLSVAAFDFFFVPPYLSFSVSDMQYLVTYACDSRQTRPVNANGVRPHSTP
jgi:two-component system sensor histidine kinase KdpD